MSQPFLLASRRAGASTTATVTTVTTAPTTANDDDANDDDVNDDTNASSAPRLAALAAGVIGVATAVLL
ncbi:hypothetical protein C6341_g26544 [Phytophthora cactorum]|nr:hypothetical protein PC120_g19678 [Phytophthora cactorum]KAG3123479.1 hypothetical protein C6341_g26544 [Phytophthora cactorum]